MITLNDYLYSGEDKSHLLNTFPDSRRIMWINGSVLLKEYI